MLGLPRAVTGAFASVYKLINNDKSWAVRCFLTSRLDQKDRYKHISDFVLFDTLECTIDFHYVEQGIQVRGVWYPCLKMPWVSGQTLDQYVNEHYRDSAAMKRLLEDFHKMVEEMECAGIGHGDLQHGNIIVTPGGLRLVDYDALFVPALLGRKSLELGHPNYQHPDRNELFYDPDVDNFSCWLISKSLLMIAIDPTLYENHLGGDDCLLFKRTDLAKPEDSQLFRILMEHSSEVIRESAALLMRMLWTAPTAIPILDCPDEMLQLLPTIRNEMCLENRIEEAVPAESLHAQTAPNRFDFIDDEALNVAEKNRKKNKRTAAQKLIELNQRRRKVVDDIYLFFSPYTWIQQHMGVALSQFEKGNYDGALNTYLRIYKVFEKNNLKRDENFFGCLMGLGYCSALSDRVALAGNYFLLASKTAGTQNRAFRAALCLAVLRYEAGDAPAAHKYLKDMWKLDSDFGKAVELELKNMFLQRTSTFELLASLGVSMQQANESRWSDVLICAKLVLDQVSNRTPIEMTQPHAEAMLGLASLYLKNSDFGRALALYQQIGRNAITSGIKAIGSQAIFNSCCLHLHRVLGEADTDSERLLYSYRDLQSSTTDYAEHLNLIADCLESGEDMSAILSSQTTSNTGSFIPKKFVLEAAFELGQLMKKRNRLDAALSCYSAATKFSVENGLDLDERSLDGLSKFNDEQIWNCLSETFFSPDKLNDHVLVEPLIKRQDARLLGLIAEHLSAEEKVLPLSLVFETVASQAPNQFARLFANLDCQREDVDGFLDSTTIQALLHASDSIDRELADEIEMSKSGATTESIIRNLDALNSIRKFLGDNGTVCMMMMREKLAPHLLEWMRTQDMQNLSSFVRSFVEYSSITDLKMFILNLANNDNFDDLEALVRSLSTWGMESEILITLLLPAAEETSDQLVERLRLLTVNQDEKSYCYNTKAGAKHLRVLVRLRSMAKEAKIGKQFDPLLRALFTPDYIPKLAILIEESELKDDLRLLSDVTTAMIEFEASVMYAVMLRIALASSTEVLLPIATNFIASGNSPIVVSLTHDLLKQSQSSDNFKQLSILLIRSLPDDEIVAFAKPIIERANSDYTEHLLQTLKAFSKTNVIQSLLNDHGLDVLNTFLMSPSRDTIASIVKTGDTKSGATLIHIAAISSDKELVKVLGDFTAEGASPPTRTALLAEAVALCDRTLTTYLETVERKPDLEENLSNLANLNMTALRRLAIFQKGSSKRTASETFHKREYIQFATNLLNQFAQRNDLENIAQICWEAAEEENFELLETFLLQTSSHRNLRPLISVSKTFCARGQAEQLLALCNASLKKGLHDAFGAVALEMVTCVKTERRTLLRLLKLANEQDGEALRILLRQISFYRGDKELKALGRQWAEAENSDAILYHSRALGLIT
jgi:tetratricopeptide (TPR) repeat protein